ncbi:MAG: DUF1592 domain-containing protein [Myxococcaceae bacterium]|nr:DUF1592 domain-containing protein [Myxococcaceae bacterium]
MRRALPLVLVVLAGCNGFITRQPDSKPGPPEQFVDVLNYLSPNEPYKPGPSSLRLMTTAQLSASLKDLTGYAGDLPNVTWNQPLARSLAIGMATNELAPSIVEQMESFWYRVASETMADPTRRAALVKCTPSGSEDAVCARAVIAAVGMKAFRRPLNIEELDSYVSVATNAGKELKDFYAGLEYGLVAIMQSPSYLYRVEIGTVDAEHPERKKLDAYELASRMSYMLWNDAPDQELLTAAAKGDLDTDTGLKAQFERMWSSPKMAGLNAFSDDWLKLGALDNVLRDPKLFPQMTATLTQAMKSEVRLKVENAVRYEKDMRSMLDTNEFFMNQETAALYEQPGINGTALQRVTLPADGPRSGLWGSVGLLTATGHYDKASPTGRGVVMRLDMLCQTVDPPPPSIAALVKERMNADIAVNHEPRTQRMKLEEHFINATCATCHAKVDPLGLALENFDAVGRFRTTDEGLPIDPSGRALNQDFKDARGLTSMLKEERVFSECLTRQVFRYATGHLELKGEESELYKVTEAFKASGYKGKELFAGIVTSDAFRYAAIDAQ